MFSVWLDGFPPSLPLFLIHFLTAFFSLHVFPNTRVMRAAPEPSSLSEMYGDGICPWILIRGTRLDPGLTGIWR